MINRDDIEAGDKVFTRDGGCLVARMQDDGDIVLGYCSLDEWERDGRQYESFYHPLDIIRIEKAPKPVVEEVWLAKIDGKWEPVHRTCGFIKLTIINGVWDKEKSEQVK